MKRIVFREYNSRTFFNGWTFSPEGKVVADWSEVQAMLVEPEVQSATYAAIQATILGTGEHIEECEVFV